MENNQLRTFAKITGIAGILVYIIYLFVRVFPALLEIDDPNTTADTSLLGFLILGYVFAWHREHEGGIMLMFITVIVGLSYFYRDTSMQIAVVLAVSIPLFFSGFLFYLHHYYQTKQLKDKD